MTTYKCCAYVMHSISNVYTKLHEGFILLGGLVILLRTFFG